MGKIGVTLSVGDDQIDRIGEVAKAARKAGLLIEQQLDTIGIITGLIEETKLAALGRIKGVSHVETERTVSIPPPESGVQ